MLLVQGMYTIADNDICVGQGYSQEFEVEVGSPSGLCSQFPALHQVDGSLVMRVPLWSSLRDDLVIIADSIEENVRKKPTEE